MQVTLKHGQGGGTCSTTTSTSAPWKLPWAAGALGCQWLCCLPTTTLPNSLSSPLSSSWRIIAQDKSGSSTRRRDSHNREQPFGTYKLEAQLLQKHKVNSMGKKNDRGTILLIRGEGVDHHGGHSPSLSPGSSKSSYSSSFLGVWGSSRGSQYSENDRLTVYANRRWGLQHHHSLKLQIKHYMKDHIILINKQFRNDHKYITYKSMGAPKRLSW